jgi:hypothetical protein
MGPMLKILNNKLQKEFNQILFLLRSCFEAKELYNPWILPSNVVALSYFGTISTIFFGGWTCTHVLLSLEHIQSHYRKKNIDIERYACLVNPWREQRFMLWNIP